MRHIRDAGLDDLEPLLTRLRGIDGLVERKRGNFTHGSRAFLHFHEDPAGYFADVRLADDFERFRVQTKAEQTRLVAVVKAALSSHR
jgi:hypothetical protein